MKINSVFWKIFFSIITALIVFVLIAIFFISTATQRNLRQMQVDIPDAYEQAKTVLDESSSLVNLEEWLLNNTDRISGLRIYIVQAGEGRDILNRFLPPRSQIVSRNEYEANLRHNEQGSRIRELRRRNRYPNLYNQKFGHFKFILAKEPPSLRKILKSQGFFIPFVLCLLLIAGLVAFLLARLISRPLKLLSESVKKVAAGELSTRVDHELANRSDDFGVLATEFDDMTEQLESLVSNQKLLITNQRQMLRDISHELRSPLARIQVALGLAEKRAPEIIQPELKRIQDDSDTLNRMIGQILSLVRFQNLAIEKDNCELKMVDLVSLISDVIDQSDYESQKKNIEIHYSGLECALMQLNQELLFKAIENIIRNAIKFSPENNSIELKLSKTKKENNDFYMLSIRDFGIGVPSDSLDKLFEPFYRVSHAREHSEGTGGVGLAIAKQAIEYHSGFIEAENATPGLLINILLPVSV